MLRGYKALHVVLLFIDTGHKQIAFETVKNSIFRWLQYIGSKAILDVHFITLKCNWYLSDPFYGLVSRFWIFIWELFSRQKVGLVFSRWECAGRYLVGTGSIDSISGSWLPNINEYWKSWKIIPWSTNILILMFSVEWPIYWYLINAFETDNSLVYYSNRKWYKTFITSFWVLYRLIFYFDCVNRFEHTSGR